MVFRSEDNTTWLRVCVDASDALQALPRHIRATANSSRSSQWALQDWLCQSFAGKEQEPAEELVVLRLAVFNNRPASGKISLNTAFGLLLLRPRHVLGPARRTNQAQIESVPITTSPAAPQPWRRLGYCHWGTADKARATRNVLKPEGYTKDDWDRDIRVFEEHDAFLRGETDEWTESAGLFG